MQILIRSKGFALTEAIDNHIKSRVESTLSRFESMIKIVEVFVSDVNGPKGGIDKLCVVKIKIDPRSELIIKDKTADLYQAVTSTFSRAKQSLTRYVQRPRNIKRQRAVMRLEDQTEKIATPLYDY